MQVAAKQASALAAQAPAEGRTQASAEALAIPARAPGPAAQELQPLHVSGVSADTAAAKVSYAGSSRKLCVSDGIFGMFLCV
jgi:hypothetical protein